MQITWLHSVQTERYVIKLLSELGKRDFNSNGFINTLTGFELKINRTLILICFFNHCCPGILALGLLI